jgi:uncharacterized protein
MNYTIITGSSKGIGEQLAYIYAKNGHNLVLVARSLELLEALSKKLITDYKVDVRIISLDLNDISSSSQLLGFCKDNNLRIDNLVNNAGLGDFGPLVSQDIDKINSMLSVNITALTNITYLFLQEIVENKGRIVLIASIAAFVAIPNMAVYAATKAYVKSFGIALNDEILSTGASVTVICPGNTKSEFQKVAGLDKLNITADSMPTSQDVAEFTYISAAKRLPIATHGLKNELMMQSLKILSANKAGHLVGSVFSKQN